MRTLSITLLLAVFVAIVRGQDWNKYDHIRTGRVDLLSGASFNMLSVPVTYNISYTSALGSSTLSSGIGIVGFNTALTNYFSVNVSITNFNIGYMFITAYALDDTIIADLSVNYIAVGKATYFLQVQSSCFLPTIINANNGSRSETRAGTTLFVNQAVLCQVYLSGFRLFNSLGLINTLSAQVSCNNANSYLNYTFNTTQNNTVSLICYTTIIYCDVCTQIQYLQWGQIGQDMVNQTHGPNKIAILNGSTPYQDYQDSGNGGNDKTFWGINTFNVSRGSIRLFNFQSDYYKTNVTNQQYNYLTNSGTYSLILAHFFIATRRCNDTWNGTHWVDTIFQIKINKKLSCQLNCISGTVQTLDLTAARYCAVCDQTCLTCDGALPQNCVTCNFTQHRNLSSSKACPCDPGYISNANVNNTLCDRCQDYIPGCNLCISRTVCQTCLSGYYILAGTCQCTTGFLITGICTTIYGCTSATNLAGTVYCLSCNASIYYKLSNNTCICMSGYFADVNGNCIGICGDSILAYGQECDDGNTKSDDGCSSTCKIQANTTCINNPMPSNCVWNYNISTSVAFVRRVLDQNKVQIALILQPENTYYTSLNWKINIQSNLSCINGGPEINHDGKYLYVTCDYNDTIEGQTFNFTLQMDNFYYLNNSYLYATIPALGMNAKLTYDSGTGLRNIQSILVMLVSILAVVILFISTISQRMIGVECVQTFQTVLYAMTFMQTSPSSIAPLQNLKYSNGYNELLGTDYARLYKYNLIIGQVGLEKEFLLSFNMSYIILIAIIAAMLFLKAVMLKFQSDRATEEKQYNRQFSMQQIHPNYKNIKKAYNIIFQRIFFVAAFWCMFIVLFSVVVQYTLEVSLATIVSTKINGFLSILALVIILGFLTLIIINGLYPKLRIFPMFMNPKYPVYYTLYNLLYISLIIAFYIQPVIPYVLAVLTVINIIVLAIWRPYPQNLHNVVILLEQVTIVVAIGIYIFEDFTASNQNNQSLFTIGFFAILGLLIAVDILSLIRLYKYYRYMKDNNLTYNDPNDKDIKEEEKNLVTPNGKQAQDNLNQTSKGLDTKKKGNQATKGVSGLLKPLQDNYYEDIKQNSKNPMNNQQQQTQRNNRNRIQFNQEDYDTFSKKKQSKRQPNSFFISPIDPNAREVSKVYHSSPYDQFGNVKLHNKANGQEQYDALKAIKSRLRKDFYQKMHGEDYVSKQGNKAENSISNPPQNFEPSDQNDQE